MRTSPVLQSSLAGAPNHSPHQVNCDLDLSHYTLVLLVFELCINAIIQYALQFFDSANSALMVSTPILEKETWKEEGRVGKRVRESVFVGTLCCSYSENNAGCGMLGEKVNKLH